MTAQFRNLIFEGGGVRGVAYAGAMRVLEQRGILQDIRRVGGSSAGAINALGFALGYSVLEQRDILFSVDFNKFMDDSFGLIRDIRRLAKHFGWYQGNFFSDWVGQLIQRKLGKAHATFSDLKAAGRPDLYVVGTNLATGYAEIFSHERHGEMPLAEAVRISMSIPLFFAAVNHNEDVYVDGGVVLNYPVKMFDRERYIDLANEPGAARPTGYYNRENAVFSLNQPGRSPYTYNRQTLGLRLDTREEIALFRYGEPALRRKIKNFTQYARALMAALMQVQENQHLHEDDWHRTIHIDTLDVKTTDFNLSGEKKDGLIRSGVASAEAYFQWFENPGEVPANRLQA